MITCDCSCDWDDGPAEFFEESNPIARKQHKCVECREMIQPGERYERVKGRWEGEYSSHATCIPCQRIRDTYCPRGYCFGMLAEQIEECLGFDYREDPKEWEENS